MRVAAAGMLAALAAGGVTAAPGLADGWRGDRGGGPEITAVPTIAGTAQAGGTLTAAGAAWNGEPGLRATYTWLRCGGASIWSCSLRPAGSGPVYRPTDADVGQRLRVWLAVTGGRDRADAVSGASRPVAARPVPAPPPTPTPSPTAAPAPVAVPPVPAPAPATVAPASAVPIVAPSPPAPSGAVGHRHARALRWLSPFPVVRIRGWLTRHGARVTILSVRAPRRAHVHVRCRGRGCPRPRSALAARAMGRQRLHGTRTVRLHPYERRLRAGVRLTISVTRRGYVGKRTLIVLRHGKPPRRRDRCLFPGSRRARRCTAR